MWKSSFLVLLIWRFLTRLDIVWGNHFYDIKSLTGEPDYRSVNLTWEIEAEADDHSEGTTRTPAFTVFYCEMQTWGAHRCKSKVYQDNDIDSGRQQRQYSVIIDNLRMATKYSFHVRPRKDVEGRGPSARSDFSAENSLDEQPNPHDQAIIIPTKGFSAHATKCLPDASEIEVETGPFFGGRILAESSNCGIKGDAENPRSSYTMRIDHEACGSHVNREEYTVKTLITVQENLGIFTHSTRRFVVVCTYQPETLTVRASFAVPGRGGAAIMSPDWHKESVRSGRERNFKMVHRSELITRENDPDRDDLTENIISGADFFSEAKFSRLIDDHGIDDASVGDELPSRHGYTGLIIAISLSMITMGSLIYLLKREFKQKEIIKKQLTFTEDRFMP